MFLFPLYKESAPPGPQILLKSTAARSANSPWAEIVAKDRSPQDKWLQPNISNIALS